MNKTEAFFKAMTSWIAEQMVSEDGDGNEILDLLDADTIKCEVEDWNSSFQWSEYPCASILVTTPGGFTEREAICLEDEFCMDEDDYGAIIPESEYPDENKFYYNGTYANEFDYNKYRKAWAKVFEDHIGIPKEVLRDNLKNAIEAAICTTLFNSSVDSDKKLAQEHFAARGW